MASVEFNLKVETGWVDYSTFLWNQNNIDFHIGNVVAGQHNALLFESSFSSFALDIT
jgi:hypothetical protein